MKQKVVVVGQGFTGRLGIVRSVAELNCHVTVVVLVPRDRKGHLITKKPIDAYSKYVSNVYYCEGFNERMLIDTLLAKCKDSEQKPVIFPDNDFAASALDAHYDELKDSFILPNIHQEQGQVGFWMDKMRQKKRAKELGIQVTDATLLTAFADDSVLPESIKYPCFIKPLTSMSGRKWLISKCCNETELRGKLATAYKNFGSITMLVEEFKEIDQEYALLGFSDGEQVTIPGILHLLSIGHGRNFGVAELGQIAPIDGFESLVSRFSEFIKSIGYIGIFDIDFFESRGSYYFCELNLRFGGSGYAYTRLGVNLPVMYLKYLLGESLDKLKTAITSTATYLNERIAIDDWYSGFISTKEFRNLEDRADIRFIQDDKDPIPQKVLSREFETMKVKRMIKKCLGRHL